MTNKLNTKGMTLIEIVIVLAISAILMVTTGSIIMSAMGGFSKTTNADIDKRSLEGVSNLVRQELIYASEVAIDTPEDLTDWKWFSLDDKGHLLQNDKSLFNDDYYNHKRLNFSVRIYNNDYRLDLQFDLHDSSKANVYESAYTLELINMKTRTQPNTTQSSNPDFVDITEVQKLYYKLGTAVVTDNPDTDTVADELNCMNVLNNRVDYVEHRYYHKGDFVFYEGFWWRYYYNNNFYEGPVNSKLHFKKMSPDFDKTSVYFKDDVVLYKDGNYYICKKDTLNMGITSVLPDDPSEGKMYWEPIEKDKIPKEKSCEIEGSDNSKATIAKKMSGFSKDDYKSVPIYDANKVYPPVIKSSSFTPLDFVKIYDDDRRIFRYYLKVGISNTPPATSIGEKIEDLGWQEVKVDWDVTNAYLMNDVVFYLTPTNEVLTIRSTKDLFKAEIPDVYNQPNPWVKY